MSPLFTKTHSLSTQGLVKILIHSFIDSFIFGDRGKMFPKMKSVQTKKLMAWYLGDCCTYQQLILPLESPDLHLSKDVEIIEIDPELAELPCLIPLRPFCFVLANGWPYTFEISDMESPRQYLSVDMWHTLPRPFVLVLDPSLSPSPSETISLRSCQPMALAFIYFRFEISLSIPSCGCVAHSATITRSWARAYPLLLPLPILILYSIGTTRAMA